MPDSLKSQAETIVAAIENELNNGDSDLPLSTEANKRANALFNRLLNTINDVDMAAAAERVEAVRRSIPDADTPAIVQTLIKQKTQKTAAIGAVTSGTGLIPGVGTATALIFGTAADIGATFKLQAELVLEIAHAHRYPLSEQEKQRVVLLVTGLSAGASSLARKAGQRASVKITEQFAEKSLLKALPFIGIIASAGTNALSTYIIGQRADAYFRLGESGLQNWQDSLRAISGVDERQISRWLAERSDATREMLASSAATMGQLGKTAGKNIAGTAQTAAASSGRVGKAYFRGVKTFWQVTFATVGGVFKMVGNGLSGSRRHLQLSTPKKRINPKQTKEK